MCVICAAVPTVAALGIAAEGEQRKRDWERGVARARHPLPALTAFAMLALFLVAVFYHTQQPSG